MSGRRKCKIPIRKDFLIDNHTLNSTAWVLLSSTYDKTEKVALTLIINIGTEHDNNSNNNGYYVNEAL